MAEEQKRLWKRAASQLDEMLDTLSYLGLLLKGDREDTIAQARDDMDKAWESIEKRLR